MLYELLKSENRVPEKEFLCFCAVKLKLLLNPMSKQFRAVISLLLGSVKPEPRKNRSTPSNLGNLLPSLVCIMNYTNKMRKSYLLFNYTAISSACCATTATSFQFYTRKTFMTSSPRWLMTFTAMRPESGLLNGYETSLFRVSQASLSISALSAVLRAL